MSSIEGFMGGDTMNRSTLYQKINKDYKLEVTPPTENLQASWCGKTVRNLQYGRNTAGMIMVVMGVIILTVTLSVLVTIKTFHDFSIGVTCCACGVTFVLAAVVAVVLELQRRKKMNEALDQQGVKQELAEIREELEKYSKLYKGERQMKRYATQAAQLDLLLNSFSLN